jgi:hypothetical protein
VSCYTTVTGDGTLELLIGTRGETRPPDIAFHALRSDGRDLFSADTGRPPVSYGAKPYSGPWDVYRIFVTRADDGSPRIHVAFIHMHEFPTVLLTLDRTGRILAEYWSNGYIDTVVTGTRQGRRVWLVGATNKSV